MNMGEGALTCQELVELVTDYLDDALPPAERERFEAHVEDCPGCAAYVEQMRVTMRLVQPAEELERRPEVAHLLRAFSDWKRSAG
jgi:anti-sigma factor RsiW